MKEDTFAERKARRLIIEALREPLDAIGIRVESLADRILDAFNQNDMRLTAGSRPLSVGTSVRANDYDATQPAFANDRPICDVCGRPSAKNADQAAAGDCPRNWAIRDPAAEDDCFKHADQRSALNDLDEDVQSLMDRDRE